jgi:predicted Zn-dependent protease
VRADFPGLPPSAAELTAKITAGGWPAGQALLEETTTRWPKATVLREPILNRVGSRLRDQNRTAEATALFEEVTRRFPDSPGAWNNLAEIYESAGAAAKARQASARGLAALPAASSLPPNRRAALERSFKERQKRLSP